MVKTTLYFFEFVGVRIPISAMTIRRNIDTTAFCSASIPDPTQLIEISPNVFIDLSQWIEQNPDGEMVFTQSLDGGIEEVIGTYNLEQTLTTKSPSGFTIVLNGVADFGDDQPSSGSYTILNPITSTDNSSGVARFSAAENPLIVVGDTIDFSDSGVPPFPVIAITVQTMTFFATTVNSRMDIAYI